MGATFIGVDLAWRGDRNHTGIVVTRGDEDGARLVSYSVGITSILSAAHFVAEHATHDTVVAIDAPLIMRNASGQRPCETMVGRRFGRFHASCHTSNLTLYPDPASVRSVDRLQTLGFRHDLDLANAKLRNGRWLFEVYPHPAHVMLFGLERIIKYKKGARTQKLDGLKELQRHLQSLYGGLPSLIATPELIALLGRDVDELRGSHIKHYEDILDALFCSYLAMHCWRWGSEKNEMFGDLTTGYIVVPAALAQEAVAS